MMTYDLEEPFYILTLDGGGSLGVYTLGVLSKVEQLVGKPLCDKFDLIYGTSTGSIIGTLLALGKSVEEVEIKYLEHIPSIMRHCTSIGRSKALKKCADEIFQELKFSQENFNETFLGVIATNYDFPRPMIFKSSIELFQGGRRTGTPGFGCRISEAVVASCSAAPFFKPIEVVTKKDENEKNPKRIKVMDGGFVANNPTLFAIMDAIKALGKSEESIRVLSIGVGNYTYKTISPIDWLFRKTPFLSSTLELFEKTLSANNRTIEQLCTQIFRDIPQDNIVRINEATSDNSYATNFLESERKKLMAIKNFGDESFLKNRSKIEKLLE